MSIEKNRTWEDEIARVGTARVGSYGERGWENGACEASDPRKRFLIARTCCTTGAELQRFQRSECAE